MGMNVGSSSGGDAEVMVDINTTPLIDVMLVLLIMLIITIPIQTHAVKLNMPVNANAAPPPTPPEIVRVDIDFDGTVLWNGEAVAGGRAEVENKFAELVLYGRTVGDQPEVHLRPNKLVKYEHVAMVMAAAQRQNVKKVGVIGNEQFVD
jgi:biopolymer transport protein ExbD